MCTSLSILGASKSNYTPHSCAGTPVHLNRENTGISSGKSTENSDILESRCGFGRLCISLTIDIAVEFSKGRSVFGNV